MEGVQGGGGRREETSPLKGVNTRTRLAKDEGLRIITI